MQESNTQFESLSTYLTLSKRVIAKFAPKFYITLAPEMLKSEDAISMIANALMKADAAWSPDYRSSKNTVKTKTSLRNQYAIWAIIKYLKEKNKYHHNLSLSYKLHDNDEYNDLSGILVDAKSPNPVDELIKNDTNTNYTYIINQLLSTKYLTSCQSKYIKSYYLEEKTLQEVGNKYGVSREAVRQGISKGLDKLRQIV
jgi:RNA polymerase sigma factor (sigma-70 family)